ncbi:hypothetical protein N7451_012310 [Penicillium sp. IBT 35674x]|nr:hypothetical protein N7451_012310 [Penicillium sp. IBT 35674x]
MALQKYPPYEIIVASLITLEFYLYATFERTGNLCKDEDTHDARYLNSYIPQAVRPVLTPTGSWQSGELFRNKASALEELIQRAFGSDGVDFVYPTGRFEFASTDDSFELRNRRGTYCWWQSDNVDGEYPDLETGLESTISVLKDSGPFDGIIGFSQGGAMAGMIASLLEGNRKDSFARFQSHGGIEYPDAFASLNHPGFKFLVSISGYATSHPAYRAFYEPYIETPSLHLLGSSDKVVGKDASMRFVESCQSPNKKRNPVVIWHPGGHSIPNGKAELDPVVRFIKSKAC